MKFLNVNRWGTAIAAVLVGFGLVACGGGGGSDDDDSSPPTAQSPTPAPQTISGRNVTFYSGTSGTRAVTFDPDDTTWRETRGGTTLTGTYQYTPVPSGSSAQLVLSEEAAETSMVLTFDTETTGSYAYANQPGEGTFQMEAAIAIPDSNNEIPPSNDGLAPNSLAGRTMLGTRTYTSTGPVGQTHVYTFSLNSFHDSDPPEESDGAYVYSPSGNKATLSLNYHSPAFFNGDNHELQLTFHAADAGSFKSVYTRRDGTVITINGTFTVE